MRERDSAKPKTTRLIVLKMYIKRNKWRMEWERTRWIDELVAKLDFRICIAIFDLNITLLSRKSEPFREIEMLQQ